MLAATLRICDENRTCPHLSGLANSKGEVCDWADYTFVDCALKYSQSNCVRNDIGSERNEIELGKIFGHHLLNMVIEFIVEIIMLASCNEICEVTSCRIKFQGS
jgi:hypothetical protein